MLGFPVQGHSDFYTEVGKGIPRAYEVGWFTLYQDLVSEQMSSDICHRRIAPDLRSLWASE
eukprot:685241-Pelagomonas_calceolata.AAC.1